MKLLAWDTSSKAGAIVALEWEANSDSWESVRLVGELSLNVDCTHSERLLWGLHQVLEAARWKIEEVDVFGVGVGPGSFTGLRIGVTTARTLAHVLKKPLMGVSSLAALARPLSLHFSELKKPVLVVAATDACKGELFALWGLAEQVKDCSVAPSDDEAALKLWKRGVVEKVLKPSELVQNLNKKLKVSGKKIGCVVIGEGKNRYADAWAEVSSSIRNVESTLFPDHVQGRYLGQLVWEAFQAKTGSEISQDGLSVFPKYLRASDAELKLKAGLLKTPHYRGTDG